MSAYVHVELHELAVTLLVPARLSLTLTHTPTATTLAVPFAGDGKASAWSAALHLTLALTKDAYEHSMLQAKLVDKRTLSSETLAVLDVPVQRLCAEHVLPDAPLELELRDKKGRQRGTLSLRCVATGVLPLLDDLRNSDATRRLGALGALRTLAEAAANKSASATFSVYSTKVAAYLQPELLEALSALLEAELPDRLHRKAEADRESEELSDDEEQTAHVDKKSPKRRKDKKGSRKEAKKRATKTLACFATAAAIAWDADEARRARVEAVCSAWLALMRVDVNVRSRLVACGVPGALHAWLRVPVQSLQMHFIECLKPFFTVGAHQQAMVEAGILDAVIALVGSARTVPSLQLKALEVLLYFDEEHQQTMLEHGLLRRLLRLLGPQVQKSEPTLSTKALEVVQYFDQRYQALVLSRPLLRQLAQLLRLDAQASHTNRFVESLLLKTLNVLNSFDVAQQRRMIAEGMLPSLLSLLAAPPARLRLRTLELVERLSGHHRDALLEAKLLSRLPPLLSDGDAPVRLAALSVLAQYRDNLDALVEAGLFEALAKALQSPHPPSVLRCLETLEELRTAVVGGEKQLIAAGVLRSLVPLIAPEDSTCFRALKFAASFHEAFDADLFEAGVFKACADLLGLVRSSAGAPQRLAALDLVERLALAAPARALAEGLLPALLSTVVSPLVTLPTQFERRALSLLVAVRTHLSVTDIAVMERYRLFTVLFTLLGPKRNAQDDLFVTAALTLFQWLEEQGQLLPLLQRAPGTVPEPVVDWKLKWAVCQDDSVSEAPTQLKVSSDAVAVLAPLPDAVPEAHNLSELVLVRSTKPLPPRGVVRWSVAVTFPPDPPSQCVAVLGVCGAKAASRFTVATTGALGTNADSMALYVFPPGHGAPAVLANGTRHELPVHTVSSGNVVTLAYDASQGSLGVAINDVEYGRIASLPALAAQALTPAVALAGAGVSVTVEPTRMPPTSPPHTPFRAASELHRWLDRHERPANGDAVSTRATPTRAPREDEWVLLYRATVHGWSSRAFHQACDNKGPTATLVTLASGHVFGGYTELSWADSVRQKQSTVDEHEFLFSLTDGLGRTPQRMLPSHLSHPFLMGNVQGPTFGASELCINLDQPVLSACNLGSVYRTWPNGSMVWLTGTSSGWTVRECEVWALRTCQKRRLEGFLALLSAANPRVWSCARSLLASNTELRKLVPSTLRAMVARGLQIKAQPLISEMTRRLRVLPYRPVAVNGFVLNDLAPPAQSSPAASSMAIASWRKHVQKREPALPGSGDVVAPSSDTDAVRHALNVDRIATLSRDDGGYWTVRHGHTLHLVLRYTGQQPLPTITHIIMRRGFDAFPARRAVVLASNEDTLPLLEPVHRSLSGLTARMFRLLWESANSKSGDDYDVGADSDSDVQIDSSMLAGMDRKPLPVVAPQTTSSSGWKSGSVQFTSSSSSQKKASNGRQQLRRAVTSAWEASSNEEEWSKGENESEEEEKKDEAKDNDEKAQRAARLETMKTTLPELSTLLDMGFEDELAIVALQRHPGNLQAAIDHIISRPESLRTTPSPLAAPAASPSVTPITSAPLLRRPSVIARTPQPRSAPPPADRGRRLLECVRDASPVAFVDLRYSYSAEAPLRRATQATYIHLIVSGQGLPGDRPAPSISYLAVIGTQDGGKAESGAVTLAQEPEDYMYVSEAVGVRSITKVCKYSPTELTTGFLYWLGMLSGKTYWLNPLSLRGAAAFVTFFAPNTTSTQYMNLASFGSYTYDTDIRVRNGAKTIEFEFQFVHHAILVSDLLIRSGRAGVNTFRDWKLTGSSDGHNYETLLQRSEDAPWNVWHHVYTFSLVNASAPKFYTHLHFTFDASVISLSGIEFYGLVSKKS